MTIFGYPFAEVKKFLLALALFVGSSLAFILHYDPSFALAVQVLVGAALAVVGVFAAHQFSAADMSKVLIAAVTALFSVLKYFGYIHADAEQEIITLCGYAASLIAIYFTSNAGHRTPIDDQRTPAQKNR